MSRAIACPTCGEEDELQGERRGELIAIRCERCGGTWERDPAAATCRRCGSEDTEAAVRAIVERSRGTQLSITSTEVVHLCRSCDADVLARYRVGRSPLMPDELPIESEDG